MYDVPSQCCVVWKDEGKEGRKAPGTSQRQKAQSQDPTLPYLRGAEGTRGYEPFAFVQNIPHSCPKALQVFQVLFHSKVATHLRFMHLDTSTKHPQFVKGCVAFCVVVFKMQKSANKINEIKNSL